ncbi:error-prone DNA polymerase [Chitinophaga nivalis]|uniref:Error-prone DNA polymerase n=1 Tax=Chitinophaga nivalis TaxID=2991709 RepID=A0ABT3IN31_9BACT|nr:error-prone DNA polymerase [Chitinophaga nivalis]MCW3464942.1 error-prone DNA polymerase [Chitinophaga nivalis]MCW3485366.1 error-prone DNA polymerase [Chitinophaga nivalis]
MGYTELQITTNFSFLRGASHPEELVEQALSLGYTAIAITDHNTLAGIVRAHAAARGKDIRIIPACRLDLQDGPPLLAYPTDRAAYGRLSAMLSTGNLRTEKGKCILYKKDVYQYAAGIKFVMIPPVALNGAFDFEDDFKRAAREYRQHFKSDLYMAASWSYRGNDGKKLYRIAQCCAALHIGMVATNDVYYHHPERRELQDIVTCVREKCTIHDAGYRLYQNAERYLKPIAEIQRLFRHYPEALAHAQEIAASCQFSLDSLEYVYPEEITTEGRTPQEELEMLTWRGAGERFPDGIPEKVANSIREELAFMARKNYAAYFLTVYDLVRFARSQDILCQGRGSAANSVVCFCLGITAINPQKVNLLFARFMSDARDEAPDIDVDFEHERREEVIQYVYAKYGRDRAGIVATVTQVHWKGAIRDVGKAMGLSMDAVDHLAKAGYEFTDEWMEGNTASSKGFKAKDPVLMKVLELTDQYIGFPRQLGQHTGGFVITQHQLSDLCPILHARMEGRTNIEWNKDDIETLGFLKVDVLALGMLTCIRKAFDLLRLYYDQHYTLATIPEEDEAVYDMICKADTIGVFQIESRAQMSMLPRLKPRQFYDLVIEVAIVRPGPIQGGMVHPYLRRRNNEEAAVYPKPELEAILKRTLGVPLFQEQAMEIAMVAADFTAAEADGLRRSMATFKAHGQVVKWREKLIAGMVKKGYDLAFAERIFKQLEGFGSYGFPESHAASFALLVYVSCWIKCYYPDVFACALLNSQPMGFYAPAQLVTDARNHGVVVRPVDVNHSHWNNTLEEQAGKYRVLRLGFRQVKGLGQEEMERLIAGRAASYVNIHAMMDAGVSLTTLERLADADAFRSMKMDRRQALWEVSALADRPHALFEGQPSASAGEAPVQLPLMTPSEQVVQDYAAMALSLKAHPVSFVRRQLFERKVLSIRELDLWPDGTPLRVAGLVLVRQRPGTASGICFITIEDETGSANLVAFARIFEQFRKEIVTARLLMVEGKLQREGIVTHVVIEKCYNCNAWLNQLSVPTDEEQRMKVSYSDHTSPAMKKPAPKMVQAELFPKGRNFK